jgi:hypothetical protein
MHWFGPVGPPPAMVGILSGRIRAPGTFARCAACGRGFSTNTTGVRITSASPKRTSWLHLECSLTEKPSRPLCDRSAAALSYSSHLVECDACAGAQAVEEMCSPGLMLVLFLLGTLPTGAVLQNTGAE